MSFILLLITAAAAISIQILISRNRKTANDTSISDVPVFNKSSIYAPADYLISKYHTWALPEGKDLRIGIDSFAMKSLGDIKIKNIAEEGKLVKKGEKIIEAEVHGETISFRSPVNGLIKKQNSELLNNNIEDEYGRDWGLIIEKENGSNELMSGNESHYWLKKEFRRFKDFLAESSMTPELVGVTMYDGGNVVEGILSTLNRETISEFQIQFLNGQENA